MIFTTIFSHKLMMSSLINKLFHFRPAYPSEIKRKKSKKKKGKKGGSSQGSSAESDTSTDHKRKPLVTDINSVKKSRFKILDSDYEVREDPLVLKEK